MAVRRIQPVARSLAIRPTGVSFARMKKAKSREEKLRWLLHDLCVDSGFCIPPADVDRIAQTKRLDADTFANEVLRAEGMVPEYHKQFHRGIRQRFIECFGGAVSVDDC